MVSFKALSIATLLLVPFAAAAPLEARECAADNALRNFRSTQHLPDSLPFCSQFLGLPLITVTATALSTAVATETASITSIVTATVTSSYVAGLQRRAISTPAFIATENYPASRISSACNCLTVPLSTTTSFVYSGTVTVTTTVSVPVATATETAVKRYFAGSNGVDSAPFNLDDAYYAITLPFTISAYGYSSSEIRVSVNGLIWLNPASTGDYQDVYSDDKNSALPQPGTNLPDISILPFWSDLFISERSNNYMAYTVSGVAPNRKVTFEWNVGSYVKPRDKYQFTASFTEGVANIFTYNFINVPDSYLGTVAAQAYSVNKVLLFSRFEGKVKSGLTLLFNTATNTITQI